MNIKEAKEQIKYTIQAYLSKNKYGEYRIPQRKQRPVFLIGAPRAWEDLSDMIKISEKMNFSVISILMDHKKTSVGTAAIDSLFCI